MSNHIDLTIAALHYSLLYLTVIVICGLFLAFGEVNSQKKRWCIVCVSLILFVLMAFRGETMGNDTRPYIAMFRRVAAYDRPWQYMRNSFSESGFLLYSWCLSKIINDARILFVATAAFITFSLGRFSYKYVQNIGVFYCLLIGTMQFDYFLSTIRNGISIAIFLFAFDYLMERKPVPYFLICAVAMLFHNSAIVFFLIYPFFSPEALRRKNGPFSDTTLVVIAVFCILFFDNFFQLLLRIFPKYTYYIGTVLVDGKARLAVALKIAVCALLMVVPQFVRKIPPKSHVLDRVGKRMSVFGLLSAVVASNATALMRVSTLFQVFILMQYSNSVERMQRYRTDKTLLILLTLIAFYAYGLVLVIFKTPEWQTTYPIRLSLWLN